MELRRLLRQDITEAIAEVGKDVPRSCSEETMELRRLLRQDIAEAIAEVGRDVQCLCREVQLLLCSRGYAGTERSVVPTIGPLGSLQDLARAAAGTEATGGGSGCAPPAGSGAAGGADDDRAPTPRTEEEEVEPSPRLEEVEPSTRIEEGAVAGGHSRRSSTRSGQSADDVLAAQARSTEKGVDQREESKPPGAANHRGSAQTDADVNDRMPYKWEWARSNGGWGRYSKSQSHHIEKAWRDGASRVRLRSTAASAPLEIFLVDMLQLDPMSGRCRDVRRIGDVSLWRKLRRNAVAIQNQIQTGEPRFETMEKYKKRQDRVVGNGTAHTMTHRLYRLNSEGIALNEQLMQESPVTHFMGMVVHSDVFMMVSMLVTVFQAIWIAIDVDKNGRDVLLLEKPLGDIIAEYLFCAYFLVELLLRLFTTSPMKACLRNRWFVFDLVCVAGSIFEAVLIPIVNAISHGAISNWKGFGVLRLLRLAKIFRICRVFGASSDAAPFFKGLLHGLRSSLFIWVLLLTMLFIFGILLRMNAQDEFAEQYFSSVPVAMRTLILKGVFLDDTGELIEGLAIAGDHTSLFLVNTFIFLGLFNLLNMLMGTFCAVAGEVAAAEKDTAQVDYLRAHLGSIVECYIQDEGLIGREDFQLIIKNADVHRTLSQCGTDMEELKSLESLMFERRKAITFETFFSAIVHLRKGKVATVKDIMHIQDTIGRKLEAIEGRLDPDRTSQRNTPRPTGAHVQRF